MTASNNISGGIAITAGTLQVAGSGTLGGGTVTDNSALVFSLSGNPTYSGFIAGTGSLTQAGTGTLTLASSNSFSGVTMIPSGTISLNQANALQYSTVTVSNNNSLIFSPAVPTFNVGGLAGGGNIALSDSGPLMLAVGGNGTSTTYGGALSGTGGLTKSGTGILTLTGSNNTFTGATTLAAGELGIFAANNLSSSSTLAFNGGVLQINATAMTSLAGVNVNWSPFSGGFDIANAANTFTLSNSITGASLSKLGPGLLVLTASDTFTGGASISAGTLQVGNGGATGSIAIAASSTLTDNATLAYNLSGNPTFAGAIIGSGNLAQSGTGVLTLLGSNTFTGVTTISAGTLQVGNGGAAGSLAGSVVDNSTLAYYLSGNPTFAGIITGSGNLAQSGTGVLTLLGSNTFTGGTTISAGTLQVGNGGAGEFLGSPSVTIAGGSALVFNHSDFLVSPGAISGRAGWSRRARGS